MEIIWLIGLRYSENLWHWAGTIITIILSFYLIIKACERLPSGTVYATFTGIGAASIVLIDIVIFREQFTLANVFLIGLIISCVVGLKLTTVEKGCYRKPKIKNKEETN